MVDFMGMMKQAAQLQTKMQALQAELDTIEVEGTAGGGMVSVRLSAKGDLKGVRIDDSLYKPSEKEILEDLLVAAHADARRKAEAVMQDKMKDASPAACRCRRGSEALTLMPTAVAGPEIERLIQLLARLPGLGPRSARRAALHLIKKRELLMAPLGLRLADGDGEDRDLQDLRQYRHAKSLHGVHRYANATSRSSWWWPTSPTCGRSSARTRSTAAITCSAARCRRSTASARRISPSTR